MTVRETRAMIAGMAPRLDPETWIFVSLTGPEAAAALPEAIAIFREAEGLSLVLPLATARRMGVGDGPAMRRITLGVQSALDGVGLTAAVATALAGAGIACNVVAACHHDHLFVPADRAAEALARLERLAAEA